jgi:predicted PurR-regulated permease PerM
VIIYLGLITAAGVTVVGQLQSLIDFVVGWVTNLPALAQQMSTQVYQFGPWRFSMEQFDLEALSQQLLSYVQPLLGRMGGLISTFATSAAATLGWSFFVLIISYFLLADAGQFPGQLMRVDIPGYDYDLKRLVNELRKIWNYLRGQLIVILLVMIAYTVLLLILGCALLLVLPSWQAWPASCLCGSTGHRLVTFLVALFQGQLLRIAAVPVRNPGCGIIFRPRPDLR